MKAPLLLFRTLCPKGLDRDCIYYNIIFLRENTRHQEGGLGLMGVSPLSLYILEDAGFLR